MRRESTGKRLRFRVFERDSFTCQYCGKKPPEVILHADHIFPISKGGENEIENLITACADCNLGKNSMVLGTSPKQTTKNKEDLEERYDQLKAFYKLQQKMTSLKDLLVDEVDEHWNSIFEGTQLSGTGKASVRRLLVFSSVEDIKDAIDYTASRNIRREDRFRYVCGILHNKRRERERKTT